MFRDMCKIYDPIKRVAFIIYYFSNKNRKRLYSASGNIDDIKDFCDRNKIDYSKCKESTVCGVHYFEEDTENDNRSTEV